MLRTKTIQDSMGFVFVFGANTKAVPIRATKTKPKLLFVFVFVPENSAPNRATETKPESHACQPYWTLFHQLKGKEQSIQMR